MSQRLLRVNELIHQVIGEILERDMRDSRFGMVTVTEVRVSKDLRYAKIFFSVFGGAAQKEAAKRFVERKRMMIRKELGGQVRLRYTPELQFVFDETGEKLDRIMAVVREIHQREL